MTLFSELDIQRKCCITEILRHTGSRGYRKSPLLYSGQENVFSGVSIVCNSFKTSAAGFQQGLNDCSAVGAGFLGNTTFV